MRWGRRVRRALHRVSPFRVLFRWGADGWSEEGFRPTWKSRVADAVLWKLRVGAAIFRCLLVRSQNQDDCVPLGIAIAHRVKAAICLLFGWHHHGEAPLYAYMDTVQVFTWNGRMTGYYEPEWEEDTIDVGAGWTNWYVELNASLMEERI